MVSQLDGSTERQNTKPSTNKGEISQAKHNQLSLQSQLLFCISKPMFQESHRLLHRAGNWNRTPQQPGQQQDSAAHMPGTAWVSGSPSRVLLLTLSTGSQRNHTTVHCASREADRKTLLLFISSEHGGGPEGKQKGHKWRCLKEASPSILTPPDSELSLLTETVSKRKFQPN